MAQASNGHRMETTGGLNGECWHGYDDLTAAGLEGLNAEIDAVAAQIAAADASLDYHEERTLETTLTPGAATAEMAQDSEERVEETREELARLEDYLGHLEVIGATIEEGTNVEATRWFADLTPDA